MSRTNPRIDAQRAILLQLLASKPNAEDFDKEAIADWQRLGMAPKFYLYNGIEAFASVAQDMLNTLDEQEQAWRKGREHAE